MSLDVAYGSSILSATGSRFASQETPEAQARSQVIAISLFLFF
jgi:hypothetical protein